MALIAIDDDPPPYVARARSADRRAPAWALPGATTKPEAKLLPTTTSANKADRMVVRKFCRRTRARRCGLWAL